MADLQQFSDLILLSIKAAQAPLLERIAGLEQANRDLSARLTDALAVRDRLVVLETKVGQPVAPDLEVRDRIAALETKASSPVSVPFDIGPILNRITVLETEIGDWREPSHGHDDQIAVLTKDIGTLRERVSVVEVRAQIPGPPGQNGLDGKDGKPGRDGLDGLGFDDLQLGYDGQKTVTLGFDNGKRSKAIAMTFPLLTWRGTFQEGTEYTKGDAVTWGGSTWHCNETTTTKPVEGQKAWTLMVRKGKDGRDHG